MRKKGMITVGVLITLLLIVIGAGFYKFNFTDNDIFFVGKNVLSEGHKTFYGSWIEDNAQESNSEVMGFVLNADGTASSINSATLVYKKWKVVNDKLILTSISMGNHQLSIDNDSLLISSYNNKKLFLKRGTQDLCYAKTDKKAYKAALQNLTFDYCPVNIENVNTIVPTHANINWKSNPQRESFRSAITNSYLKGKANFAGYYQVITWGCGSCCQEGVMIDTRDGRIYELPTIRGLHDIGKGSRQQIGSILLITYTILHNPNTQKEEINNCFWLWNENAKEFVLYK